MREIKYFSSAWNDIMHSPGWFGKLCLLGLVLCIPIFGVIVVSGYLYGWAREIAWGVHEPMPERIFGNEDGKLYRRGGYLFLFNLILAIIVGVILGIVGAIPGMATVETVSGYGSIGVNVVNYSIIYSLIYIVLLVVEMFIAWIGSMRISVYDRLSAGFQFGKLWKMYSHKPGGIWRIFGMQLLVGIIVGAVLGIIFSILLSVVFVGAIGAAAPALYGGSSVEALIPVFAAAGPAFLIVILLMGYAFMVATVFLEALCARALGYWTMQFDVPHWRSQDEPMPFEDGAPF